MRLRIGDEFREPTPGAGATRDRPAYRVTGVVLETPRFGLYEGKKLLTSYHFGRRVLEATSEQEGLTVFLKSLHYPTLNKREYIKDRRDMAWFEVNRVLGRSRSKKRAEEAQAAERVLGRPLSNLLPEPLDYLRVENTRDAFAIPNLRPLNLRQLIQNEPILVLERVHGQPLGRWREQSKPPLALVLRVLADLLDFMATLHAEGLLLGGLSPDAVWADDEGRTHYLGSDMVLTAEPKKQAKQRQLFSHECYAAGYTAPEVFQDRAIGPPADLYAWGTLAYFLITGHDSAELANPAAFDHLGRELQALPRSALPSIQQTFRATGARFASSWPESLVHVIRECVQPVSGKRPESCPAIGRLWQAARPAPPFALAIHNGKQVEILVQTRHLEAGLEFVVRAGSVLPTLPSEGRLVYEGPLRSRIVDTKAPAPVYAVFARVRSDGPAVYSAAGPAILLDLVRPVTLVQFIESSNVPDVVGLLAEASEVLAVARAWLGSPQARVRGCAVVLLQGLLREKGRREAALTLLLRCVGDADPALRQGVLRLLIAEERATPELAGRLVQSAGMDAGARLLADLAAISADGVFVATVAARLAGEQPIVCAVCQQAIRQAEHEEHLQRVHHFVRLGNQLRPLGEVMLELWRRMLIDRDAASAADLAKLFTQKQGENAASAFGAALEQQARLHLAGLAAIGPEDALSAPWVKLAECLAAHELTQRVCRTLLNHDDARWRRLARRALVPHTVARLHGVEDVGAFRTSLEALCPREDVATKVVVCRLLRDAGANAKAANAVAAQLQPGTQTAGQELVFGSSRKAWRALAWAVGIVLALGALGWCLWP